MKNILLLGATGSIGDSVLSVISQNKEDLNLYGIAAGKNSAKIESIIHKYSPKHIYVDDKDVFKSISSKYSNEKIFNCEDELFNMIKDSKVDIVISAIVGFAGLKTSMVAVDSGKTVLIANKESIVAAGELLMSSAHTSGAKIIPVDSEHNAIFQCLPADKSTANVSKITITASGGPFLDKPLSELSEVTPEDALKHPRWDMGAKISIDSATLVNKCLELIEARYLFNLNEKYFDLVIHPQSIIHSIVSYIDGSSIAQMSNPNMEVPIANALGQTHNIPIAFKPLNFSDLELNFKLFPKDRSELESLAREVCNKGGSSGLVFNAANEVAVESFLKKKITFTDIYDVIYRTFDSIALSKELDIESLNELDKEARMEADKVIKSLS